MHCNTATSTLSKRFKLSFCLESLLSGDHDCDEVIARRITLVSSAVGRHRNLVY